jgi:hemolysin activation/secretion protein
MSTSTLSVKITGVAASLLISTAVFAAAPDAGQLLRDQPQPTDLGSEPAPETRKGPVTSGARSTGGTVVTVSQFRFTGNEGLATEAELQDQVRSWVGRSLTAAELQDAAAQVTALLRQKGYVLARAYLPRQDVTSGVVEVAIVQARVDGTVGVHTAEGVRLSAHRAQMIADGAVVAGQPLREQGLDRALQLINSLPGVMGRVLLEQGTAPGTTRVSLDVSEGSLFSGSVWADNFGSRYTGALRGNALVSLNDPMGIGDQVAFLASGSEDMYQGRLTYSAPLGSTGLRGNVSGSLMDYSLGKEFAALDMEGRALTLNAWFSYPLILAREKGVSLTAGYEYKALKDDGLGVTLRDRRLQSGSLGLNGFFRDSWGGGGYTAWSVAATTGTVDLSRVAIDTLADRLGPKVDGGFTRFNLSLSRLQRLPGQFSFSAAYFGQVATGNLNSSEKFGLGGPYGVRAYPVGEASGDEGHQFNFELRRDFDLGASGSLQLVGFYDVGLIRLNSDPWTNSVNTATRKNSYALSGAGLGLNYSWNSRASLRLSYAWQIGDNDGRSMAGNNADGRDHGGCFWITGQFRF